jgi:hypothetical protein
LFLVEHDARELFFGRFRFEEMADHHADLSDTRDLYLDLTGLVDQGTTFTQAVACEEQRRHADWTNKASDPVSEAFLNEHFQAGSWGAPVERHYTAARIDDSDGEITRLPLYRSAMTINR